MLANFVMADEMYFSYSSAFARGVFPCQTRAITGLPGREDRAAIPGLSSPWAANTNPAKLVASSTPTMSEFVGVSSLRLLPPEDARATAGSDQNRAKTDASEGGDRERADSLDQPRASLPYQGRRHAPAGGGVPFLRKSARLN